MHKRLVVLLPLLLAAALLLVTAEVEVKSVSLEDLSLNMTWRVVPAPKPVEPILRGGSASIRVKVVNGAFFPVESTIRCRFWLEGEPAGELEERVSLKPGVNELIFTMPLKPGSNVKSVLYEFAGMRSVPLYYRVEVTLGGSSAQEEGSFRVSLPKPRLPGQRF